MDALRQELDQIFSHYPEMYCTDGARKTRDESLSIQEYISYVGIDNNLMQWEWGKGCLSTDFFKRHRDRIAEGGVRMFFNEVPSDSKETDIVLVDSVSGLDFTGTKCKVAVKDVSVTVEDNKVWAYGTATVIAIGKCDALMQDKSVFVGKSDKCGCELFGEAKACGKGFFYPLP